MSLLTPQQRVILDHLNGTAPVSVERLITILYADRYDGGPDSAPATVRKQVSYLRERLAPYGVRVLTVGGPGRGAQGYMVDPDCQASLEALLAALPATEMAIARMKLPVHVAGLHHAPASAVAARSLGIGAYAY